MNPITSKEELIKLFINGDLFSYVMKIGLVKKGDSVNYAQLLDLGEEDLRSWFEKRGYPGLKNSPPWSENDYAWTLSEGVYTVLFIERNLDFPQFSTSSRQEFETWWKAHALKKYAAKLHYTWTL